jgi:pyridoxamine 5'-phosphate oxidase-like protein
MSGLSEGAKALLSEPIPAWATTVRPDGSLHNTVVWVDVDGDDVIFNTAIGRAKERHLRSTPTCRSACWTRTMPSTL